MMAYSKHLDIKKPDGAGKDSGKKDKDTDKNTAAMKSMTAAVTVGNVLANLLTGALEGVMQLISPVIRILSALLVVIFMPLLPILRKLTKVLSQVVTAATSAGGGPVGLIKGIEKVTNDSLSGASIGKRIGVIILAILTVAAVVVAAFFLGIPALIAVAIAAIVTLLILAWDPIVETFLKINEQMVKINEAVREAFWGVIDFIIQMGEEIMTWGSKIWEIFVEGLAPVSKIGQMIVDAVASALKSVKKAASKVGSSARGVGDRIVSGASKTGDFIKNMFGFSGNDFLMRPGQAPIAFSPDDTIMGIKDSSKLGGGSISIVINNPVVRDETDLRKLTEMISSRLQAKGNRRFSTR